MWSSPLRPLTSGPLVCGQTRIRANKDCATGAFGAACAASGNIYRCRRAGRFLFTLPAPLRLPYRPGMGLIPPLSLAYLARRAPVEKKRVEGEMIDVGRCSSRGVLGERFSLSLFVVPVTSAKTGSLSCNTDLKIASHELIRAILKNDCKEDSMELH